jgi:two-component system, chemotaxis family, response regulator Rcp1
MHSLEILVVDDSRGDQRLIEEALKEVSLRGGYQLHQAGDGVEALELLGWVDKSQESRIKPDFIIRDLNMPRMDGREFLSIMKTDKYLKDIPVIVLTTSSAEADIFEAYRLNANCYVTKPMNINEFIDTVQKLADFWTMVTRGQAA